MRIGLYVHIPFCKSKCYYCDFLSFPKMDRMEDYVEALVNEIQAYGKKISGLHTIGSIFIGGGTPTVLPPFLLDRVCSAIKNSFDLEEDYEWSIEANPGTIEEGHALCFIKNGVNRVSIGLQACQNTLLKQIGRVHQVEDWEATIDLLKKHGIDNINTDLMFGLPNQTLEDFKETLEWVAKKQLKHLSVYSLIIEEDTVFYEQYETNQLELPEESIERDMYTYAKNYLKEMGYNQYEISNWSKEGYPCKHNILYWQQGWYIGVGLGSHAYMDEVRYSNTRNINDYIDANGDIGALVVEEEPNSIDRQIEEFMFLGLRLIEGVSFSVFERKFGVTLFEAYGEVLKEWINQEILIHQGDRLYLSERGIEVSNQVFTSFLK